MKHHLEIFLLASTLVCMSACSGRQQNSGGGPLCVAHLEVPTYPTIARMVGLQGGITATLEINSRGRVVAARFSGNRVFQAEVERSVRKWTFSHLPRDAKFPISRTVRFEFRIEGRAAQKVPAPTVTFDLPDRVSIVTQLPPMNPDQETAAPNADR